MRAVQEAAQAFKAVGADTVDWGLRLGVFEELGRLFPLLQSPDGAKWLFDALEGEEVEPSFWKGIATMLEV